MRVRSVRRRRRSVTAPGTIVTDMDSFRHLKAADHARLSTVVSEGNYGSRQPTNHSCLPPMTERGMNKNALFGVVYCFDQFGHSGIRRPDLTMEEFGDDIVICCCNRWRLSVILRQRSNKLTARVRRFDIGHALLAAHVEVSIWHVHAGRHRPLDDVKRGLEALAHGRSGHGALRRLAIGGHIEDSK